MSFRKTRSASAFWLLILVAGPILALPSLRPTARQPRFPGGVITNKSSKHIWITAENKKYCLGPGKSSKDFELKDADGLLLNGRKVMLETAGDDPDKTTKQIYTKGAIKICDLGTMDVFNGEQDYELFIFISTGVCRPLPISEWSGYKDEQWCRGHSGWDINTAPLGAACK